MKIGQNDANTKTMQAGIKKKKTYEPIPKSAYRAIMTSVKEKKTNKGDGTYLEATFRVVDGEFKSRLIWHKFNIDSPYAKCKEIGLDQLNKFLKCVGQNAGLGGLDFDTDRVTEYLNKDVIINVGIEEASNGFKARNKVTSFGTV